ncbi:hypothetical protein HPG69_019119, partial [Diceros bicornis minor]
NSKPICYDLADPVLLSRGPYLHLQTQPSEEGCAVCSHLQDALQLTACSGQSHSLRGPGAWRDPDATHNIQAWASAEKSPHHELRTQIQPETPDLVYELLPQTKCHHKLIQLYLTFHASAEEEGSSHIPHPAAPEVLKKRKIQHRKDAESTTGQKQRQRMALPRLTVPGPQNSPLPITDPSAPPSAGLPITSALSSNPSTSTSASLAPQPASDTEGTPMDATPPSQPLLLEFPPAPTLQMPFSDIMASVTVITSLPVQRLCGPTPTLKLSVNPGANAQTILGPLMSSSMEPPPLQLSPGWKTGSSSPSLDPNLCSRPASLGKVLGKSPTYMSHLETMALTSKLLGLGKQGKL